MLVALPPASYYIVAQANYSCDAYGVGNYGQCEVKNESTTGGSSSGGNNNSGSEQPGNSSDNEQGGTGTLQPSRPGADTPDTATPIDAIGGLSWWWIIAIALVASIITAWFILLWKRHKRRYEQQPPTNTIYPTGFSG